ncbi:MAG: malate synthase G, partial [Caulobacteraceae bacterium]
MERRNASGLQVAQTLYDFIEQEALPGTGIAPQTLWPAFAALVEEFAPRNRALLDHRDALQAQIDTWHGRHPAPFDATAYTAFLREIGYLQPEPAAFAIDTAKVDDEIARLA